MSRFIEKYIRLWHWYLLAALIVVLDQWTKHLATGYLEYGRAREIFFFFDLRLIWNRGAAFSFLSDASGWQRWFLLAISVAVSVLIALWWLPDQVRRFSLLGMALILGGALGNLWDRAVLGYVIDFISVHYQGHYFPAFNIADSAISLGAVVLGVDWLILEPREMRAHRSGENNSSIDPAGGRGTEG